MRERALCLKRAGKKVVILLQLGPQGVAAPVERPVNNDAPKVAEKEICRPLRGERGGEDPLPRQVGKAFPHGAQSIAVRVHGI